jgi:hypothetical protein
MRHNTASDDRELEALLHSLCNGCLDQAGLTRLAAKLEDSDEACRRYIDAVHLCVSASYVSGIGSAGDADRDDGSLPLPSGATIAFPILEAPPQPWDGGESPLNLYSSSNSSDLTTRGTITGWLKFLMRPRVAGLAAAVVLLGAFGIWMGNRKPRADFPVNAVAENDPEQDALEPREQATASTFVARIVKASSDCVWGKSAQPEEFLLRIRAGDLMHLVSGLVELEFQCGARIILNGPAMFTPTGPASGHLESGRLTGKVSKGNFRLVTPTAEVIDLGTEFGVVADAKHGCDVVVFDGRVQVVSRSDGTNTGKVLDMTEGMAARFRVDGTTEYGLPTDAATFKRDVGSRGEVNDDNEICLIDVLAGGDGLGKYLAGAIDPLSGQKDYGSANREKTHRSRKTDGLYHPSDWHSMIDGLFIPTRNGKGVQVDSAGHQIDLPKGTGLTWASVWARSKESVLETEGELNNDFWGDQTLKVIAERLKQVDRGLIGIHASVGITFDLQAIRLVHRRSPIEFRGAVANIDNSHFFPDRPKPRHRRSASMHIIVDGKLRYERLSFGRADGDARFVVPLGSNDRFLTVISTDDGHIDSDHVVLIDPVIGLPRAPQKAVELDTKKKTHVNELEQVLQ